MVQSNLQSAGMAVDSLRIVNKFRNLIKSRNTEKIDKSLYEFFHLYCGFICHYNINGFREEYASPRQFADVFIRSFDRDHRYCTGLYSIDYEEEYLDTGFTRAEIKRGILPNRGCS